MRWAMLSRRSSRSAAGPTPKPGRAPRSLPFPCQRACQGRPRSNSYARPFRLPRNSLITWERLVRDLAHAEDQGALFPIVPDVDASFHDLPVANKARGDRARCRQRPFGPRSPCAPSIASVSCTSTDPAAAPRDRHGRGRVAHGPAPDRRGPRRPGPFFGLSPTRPCLHREVLTSGGLEWGGNALQRGELVGRDRNSARYWYFGGPRLYMETRDDQWSACCTTLADWEALIARATDTDRKAFGESLRAVCWGSATAQKGGWGIGG